MRAETLCGLLAADHRRRCYAAVVLGAQTPEAVAGATGLAGRDVLRALHRLEAGGLVSRVDGRLQAPPDALAEAVREAAAERPAEPSLDPDPGRAAVLRSFVRDGRLAQMPAPGGKRRIVLEHIAAVFEPGRRYPERMVNAVLRAWYDDYAALRRYLVDEALLARADGEYWRAGGPVEI